MVKPILEVRAGCLNKGEDTESEERYRDELKTKYENLTNGDYYVIVLIDDTSLASDNELLKYPKLTVL